MKNYFSLFLVSLLFLVVSSPALSAETNYTQIEEKTYQGIPYLTGGAGKGEREDIREKVDNYNLKLVFALEKGNYLGNVEVEITDPQGNTVLKTTTDGPWLFTKLPAGSYTVKASARGETKQRNVEISQGVQEIIFPW